MSDANELANTFFFIGEAQFFGGNLVDCFYERKRSVAYGP